MPTSASASAGASLTPSPTIATTSPGPAQLPDDLRPCPRASRSPRPARARRSQPLDRPLPDRPPRASALAPRVRAAGRRSRTADDRTSSASVSDRRNVPSMETCTSISRRDRLGRRLPDEGSPPDPHQLARHGGLHAVAVLLAESRLAVLEREPTPVRPIDEGARKRMCRERVGRGREPQDLVVAPARPRRVPSVSVPVLSSATTVAWPRRSSAPPPLTMIPRRAALAMPDTNAIGVARIRGHGVATTSTARAARGPPVISQPAAAVARVSGRKIAAARSATRIVGARSASADSTRRTIARIGRGSSPDGWRRCGSRSPATLAPLRTSAPGSVAATAGSRPSAPTRRGSPSRSSTTRVDRQELAVLHDDHVTRARLRSAAHVLELAVLLLDVRRPSALVPPAPRARAVPARTRARRGNRRPTA